jgi:hypothetical protein
MENGIKRKNALTPFVMRYRNQNANIYLTPQFTLLVTVGFTQCLVSAGRLKEKNHD